MNLAQRLTLLMALFSLGACNTINSEDVKTSGISISADIISTTGTDSEVTVFLTSGSGFPPNSVNLSAGDTLTVSASGTSKTIPRTSPGIYKTTIPIGYSANFTVALTRDNDTDAPNTYVKLPVPFIISSPSNNQSFANGDAITLNWSPSNYADPFLFSFETTCTDTTGQQVQHSGSSSITDNGAYTVQSSSLFPTNVSINTSINCLCSLSLQRSSTGSADPNYDGGSISAKQLRTISINLSP